MTDSRWPGRCSSIFTSNIRAKTLFATHYHELTELAEQFEGIRNLHVSVKEAGDQILFLRKVEPGAADRSYGIEVARLAALAAERDRSGQEILALHERNRTRMTEELTPVRRSDADPVVRACELRDRGSHPHASMCDELAADRSFEACCRIAAGAEEMRVAGIMSGTSLDGIDVAVVDIEGGASKLSRILDTIPG